VAGGPGGIRWMQSGKVGGFNVSGVVVQLDYYWSSTTNANNTDYAWNVNLNNGNVNNNTKVTTYYAWPVRGGEWWFCRPILKKKEMRYV